MVNDVKRFFYDLLFDFDFFQKLFFINDKILFFNLTFFFRKRQLLKWRPKFNRKAKISLLTLIKLKVSKFNFKNVSLTLILNIIFKLFVTLLKNFTFSLILIYYFFTFLVNLVLFSLKLFYKFFLYLRLLLYKLIYWILESLGFQTFFFLYNFFYTVVIFCTILAIFVVCFYFFKTNYFNTDYFYVNFFPYDNSLDEPYLSTKQLYYYRFSLWWIFRIYLLYFVVYVFVKDFRQLIKEHLLFIIFLPIVICNFNFKFFIFLVLGTFLDVFGSLQINKDMFFFFRTPFRPLKLKRPFTLKYLHNKFNFLFSNSLVEESRKGRVLQSSTSNNLDQFDSPLNLRDESTSYKAEILRIKKLKAIQNYYLDFKIIPKKNKLLEAFQNDMLADAALNKNGDQNNYYRFFYYSNYYTIGKQGDPLNLLKKNSNNLIKLSPYLDINLINNDNYKSFKTNNYYKNNRLYREKLRAIHNETPTYEDYPTAYYRAEVDYNKIGYVYDLFNEINNKKLKQRANKLVVENRFEELIADEFDQYDEDEDENTS